MGLTIEGFWSSTPRELALYVRARARRAESRARRDLAIAWHIAAFNRIERLPPLEAVLRPRRDAASEDLQRRAREHQEIVARMSRASAK
ncbi:MAG: hypothetical protein ACHQZS_07900 [Candidatus Binatales bacterium]